MLKLLETLCETKFRDFKLMKRTFITVFEESCPIKYILFFSGFKKVKIINLTDVNSPYSQTKFVTICTIALHDFYSTTIEFFLFLKYM